MIVIKKEPGKDPILTDINNNLKALQNAVGGYIETFTIGDGMTVICNEEGRILGLPYNCTFKNLQDFYGTIVIAGTGGEEFIDVPVTASRLFAGDMWVKGNA